jgi:hypothetical protein
MIKWSRQNNGNTTEYRTSLFQDREKFKIYLNINGGLNEFSVRGRDSYFEMKKKPNSFEFTYEKNGEPQNMKKSEILRFYGVAKEAVEYLENRTFFDNLGYLLACGGIKSSIDMTRKQRERDKLRIPLYIDEHMELVKFQRIMNACRE